MDIVIQSKGNYFQIKSKNIEGECNVHSDVFQLKNKWYIRCILSGPLLTEFQNIDAFCSQHANEYKSCIHENTVLVKIPYRYKKFEADIENCSFHELKAGHKVTISFIPISISKIGKFFTCCFKLKRIILHCSEKHPHAHLASEECE